MTDVTICHNPAQQGPFGKEDGERIIDASVIGSPDLALTPWREWLLARPQSSPSGRAAVAPDEARGIRLRGTETN
jgi:hypothetical protein